MTTVDSQLALDFRANRRGGKRKGAGRKKTSNRVPHAPRPTHKRYYPVHATARALPDVGNLRESRRAAAIRSAVAAGCDRGTFRVVHFSIQRTHLHFLVEASTRDTLWRGLRGLEIRIARALNRELERRGRVFADRYHARALKTPRETRNCLAYVLLNARHHAHERGAKLTNTALDPCSSSAFFDGWREKVAPDDPGPSPIAAPRTWLARIGWRKAGLISVTEIPGPKQRPPKLRRAATRRRRTA